MIDYILVEKVPSPFLADGVTPRTQSAPYAVSFDRLGFKGINIDPKIRTETIPKLDGTFDIQHHGSAGRVHRVQGNIRLDGIGLTDGSRFHRSLAEYVAEQEALKLRWLAEKAIICVLIKQIDHISFVELQECYVSGGLRIQMPNTVAGEPLLRTWTFELTEIYHELDEASIFDGTYLPIPGALTQLPDLSPGLRLPGGTDVGTFPI